MAGEPNRGNAQTINALVHLYRGEVVRADAWRSRLDNTTNWALTTTAAVISFGLSSPRASHGVLIAGMYLVVNFLLIETRRYRAWDVFLRRVRILEVGLYAPLLRDEAPEPQSLRELALMLDAPRIVIPFWTALGQRIKRAYGPVLGVLLIAWVVKLFIGYREAGSLPALIDRMHLGVIPGWLVLLVVALTYLALGAVTTWSFISTPPNTELLAAHRKRRTLREAFERQIRPRRLAPRRPAPPRPQQRPAQN